MDRESVAKVAQGFALPAHCMIPPGFPGFVDDKKTRDIQRFDPKLAMAALKGTPYEGGKNWPKIVLSMRRRRSSPKPMAEAVQAILLENLNMKTELEVLEQRVFRERLWKQDLQLVWIRWFMDYPDPHNEYFDTFYSKRTTGKRQAWGNEAFDKELEAGRDTRDAKKRLEHYARAEEILQTDVGYVPVTWVVRYAVAKPSVRGIEKNKAGEQVIEGNIYNDMLTPPLHGRAELRERPRPPGGDPLPGGRGLDDGFRRPLGRIRTAPSRFWRGALSISSSGTSARGEILNRFIYTNVPECDSRPWSRFLFGRAFLPKAGNHFSGTCSDRPTRWKRAHVRDAYWPPGSFWSAVPGVRESGLETLSGGGKMNRISAATA